MPLFGAPAAFQVLERARRLLARSLNTGRRGSGVALILGVLAGLGSVELMGACRPDGEIPASLPEVAAGEGELQFFTPIASTPGSSFTPPSTDVLLDKLVPIPFEVWAWRQSALDARTQSNGELSALQRVDSFGADIPVFPLISQGPTPVPLDVRFRATVVDFSHQQEAMLFARDPEEMYQTLNQTDQITNGWSCIQPGFNPPVTGGNDIQGCELNSAFLPSALTIPYPGSATASPPVVAKIGADASITGPGPWATVSDLSSENFWQSGVTPTGPGAAPDGVSSVKAVQVVQHGFCSADQNIDDILSTLSDQGWNQFITFVQKQSGCADVFRFWSNTTSHLHQISDEETTQQGGFLLNFDYGIDVHHTGHGSASDTFEGDFEWALSPNDRRLTVTPNIIATQPFGDGTDSSALDSGLRGMVPTAVSSAIYQQADRAQVFYGLPNCANAPNCFDCTPRGTNQEDPTIPVGDTQNACAPFITRTQQLVKDGAGPQFLTPPLSTLELDEVLTTTVNAHHVDANGDDVFDWFRCNAYTDNNNQAISRCEYVVPAKRLVALPDQVELVFLDSNRELENPAYPIYLIASQLPVLFRAPNPLCSAQSISGPTSQRSFVNEFRGYTEVQHSTSVCL